MEKASRRSFMAKLTFGVSTLAFVPLNGIGKWLTGNSKPTDKPPIKSVQALGFQWNTLDPFLFCVHHEDHFPKGTDNLGPDVSAFDGRTLGDDFIIKDGFRMYHGRTIPGFPGHPHRGFETITVVRKGFVDHADSLGAAGRYGNGDVQWMTAGGGVQHSEMFPLLNKDKDNPMELFQIWLNLPKKHKMVDPHFKMLWSDEIPNYEYIDSNKRKTNVEVIAGKLDGHKAPLAPPDSWAYPAENEIAIWNISMEPGATWEIPAAAEGLNRMLYFYEGEGIMIAGNRIPRYHSVELDASQTIQLTNGNHESKLLLLQGKPIDEPVIQYGPFVMNTKEEINQAFADYHSTQFGGWPWPRHDQVHARDKGRFAKHADGRMEIKS